MRADGGLTARDGCESWCLVERDEHEEHRDPHSSRSEMVTSWGSDGEAADVFLRLIRPYVEGVPLDQIKDRHIDVELSLGDDVLLTVVPPVARSLAAALVRLADLAEVSR